MEEGFKRLKAMRTVVWWDLHTCPVPDGYDVRRVRPCIVSAVKKHFGSRPVVTIFAIGNLEIISPLLLKEISSAGIHLYILYQLLYHYILLTSNLQNHLGFSITCSSVTGTGILLMNSMNLDCPAEFASIIAATDITCSSTSTLHILVHHALASFSYLVSKCLSNVMFDWGKLIAICFLLLAFPTTTVYPLLPTTTVVLWDLNTCPVPPGYDIGCVRPSIESALNKLFGSLPVTVFAIGNLDLISPRVLKEIFSFGILLIHSPFGYNFLLFYGHTILRAFPKSKPAEAFGSYEEWCWETLLEENSSPPLETNSQDKCTETGEDACFCLQCEVPVKSFDGFIDHLQSKEHKEELWANVPLDTDNNPIYICELCNYPADSNDFLTLHLKSEEHLLKEEKMT
ncbi:unnamed protein product [Thlaspi arvense]|uniref:NYN domain-containing protein n=1 Tax=Thlaspi arvense TaxID=13288 RepID=A0AAU9SGT6_THLAR|nr:unnamed protein product [Thlaspi arvense]